EAVHGLDRPVDDVHSGSSRNAIRWASCRWVAARRGVSACRRADRRGADRPRPRSALHRRRHRPPRIRQARHVPRTFTSPVPPAHAAVRVYSVAMTFSPDAEIRSDNVSASGRGGGSRLPGGGRGGRGLRIVGGSGCLLLVVVVVYALLGGNPLDLLGGGTGTSQGPVAKGGPLEHCLDGADANERDDCLVQATIESGDSLWAQLAPASGMQFVEPQGRVFDGSVQTGCGAATADVGPFYCPADATIYVDVSFFDALSGRYGADGGQLAKMYV